MQFFNTNPAASAGSYYANDAFDYLQVGIGGSTYPSLSRVAYVRTSANVPIVWRPGDSEWMRMTTTGYLGIGTTSPQLKCEIANGGTPYNLYLSGSAPNLYFGSASGIIPNGGPGQTVAGCVGFATANNQYTGNMGDLIFITQSFGAGNSCAIRFATPAADTGSYSARMTITRDGLVGIGSRNPTAQLEVVVPNGSLALRLQGSVAATNNTQLRFYGSTAAADLWAFGTDIATGNGSQDLHVYDMATGPALVVQKNTRYVAVGGVSPTSQLYIGGNAGTAAPLPGGGTIYVQSSGSGVNDGGAIVFGCVQGYWAGIKASLANGGGNTAGELRFYIRKALTDTALTQGMIITSAGNVGIGNDTPSSRLSFGAADPTIGSRIAFYEIAGSANFRGIGMVNTGVTFGVGIWADNTAAPTISNTRLFVADAGFVGIGTNNPGAPLSFGPTLGDKIFLYDGGGAGSYGMGVQSGQLQIFTNNAVASIAFGIGGSSATFSPFLVLTPTSFTTQNLPSANPGAGTKQLWYDPADGNRVKYAA